MEKGCKVRDDGKDMRAVRVFGTGCKGGCVV
jgi:hypothetical protein